MRFAPFLVILLLSLTSCNLVKRLGATTDSLQVDYQELKLWDELPVRFITWNQALSIMRENNLDLRRAQNSIAKAERDARSVYTDMIPGVTYYGYFTSTIEDLMQSSDNSLDSNINVSFAIPALTQVPYRVYSAKATAYAAIKAKEGKERELASKLYQSMRKREMNGKIRALEQEKHDYKEPSPQEMSSRRQADVKNWQEVADVLGSREARWFIMPETVPRVEWSEYRSKMDKLDPLVVCNYAMKLESARLACYGVALNYLPTLNTSLYSPSLFSSTGGTYQGAFLSSKDTKISLNIGYSFDTQLRAWDNYKNALEDFDITRRSIANELMDRKEKLNALKRSVEEYEVWKSFMNKKMKYIQSSLSTNGDEYMKRENSLYDMRRELLVQEDNLIETEAALFLEYGAPKRKKQ